LSHVTLLKWQAEINRLFFLFPCANACNDDSTTDSEMKDELAGSTSLVVIVKNNKLYCVSRLTATFCSDTGCSLNCWQAVQHQVNLMVGIGSISAYFQMPAAG